MARTDSRHISKARLTTFPAFFRVDGEVVIVIGNGEEAFAKTRLLANTSAHVRVVADEPEERFAAYLAEHGIERIADTYTPDYLDGARLVFAATGESEADRQIAMDARARRIPANAVDQPDACDFFTPALVNRAPLCVAIGTEGAGPVLAQMVRTRVDRMLSPRLGDLASLASTYRTAVEKLLPRGAPRRLFWRRFFTGTPAEAMERGDVSGARRAATALLRAPDCVPGHVWLVGAGPGAADLITLRAHRVMMEADVIVHDALVPQEIVDLARRDAERIAVGKRKGCHSKKQSEINDLLVELAGQGKRVVRLKSGDPLVYGRAGEELAALRHAGIGHEIVPGITSALAAAADFGLPPTLRGVASSLVFATGHDLTGAVLPEWGQLTLSGATVAVYMGRSVAARVASRLIEAGLPRATTVAVVENASREDCRLFHGVLEELPALETNSALAGPVMVIVGEAVAGADFTRSMPLAEMARALEAA
ncbi:siroheme synthase CysG [Pararhizobium mangrovi]|uniref:Uroporphyrinogen-III C-methyltransferase n=1 Tax=Pararhizobium mangrovi TaxID=2590452 RepID=A0A506UBM3_9HYPH|nr:siroheme synthase CysG [Pararhizobium mangrovi]TPW31340.1 uroporphyrinogen-III C-methyltransferase [Pararhizobium mangrovi]